MVYEAAHAVNLPVIGIGGISTGADVVEFMLAGAVAVEVGTANYWDPCATENIARELAEWCTQHRVLKVTDLTGAMKAE
jgi:dihydroorotate dehydrogenase (NAD+) catalytic subunit